MFPTVLVLNRANTSTPYIHYGAMQLDQELKVERYDGLGSIPAKYLCLF